MALFKKSEPKPQSKPEPPTLDFSAFVDRRVDAVYDRVRFKAGVLTPTEHACFQDPIGSPGDGRPRTITDTNMRAAHQFYPPEDLIVRRILYLIQPSVAPADRAALLANYGWRFHVLEKAMTPEVPMVACAVVGVPEDLIEDFGKVKTGSKIGEIAANVAWDLEKYACYIPPLCYFSVRLQGVPFRPVGDIDFYVMLHGLRDHPVQ